MEMPARVWSLQQQDVLDAVGAAMDVDDANALPGSRAVFVTGGPGTGKTALTEHVVRTAVGMDLRVLRVHPTGRLVADCWRHKMVI